jgi:hypothetical protein
VEVVVHLQQMLDYRIVDQLENDEYVVDDGDQQWLS